MEGQQSVRWSCYHGEQAAHNPARTFQEPVETAAQPHSSKCGPGAFLDAHWLRVNCPGTLPATCSQVTSAYALSSLVLKSQRLGEGRDNLQFVPEVRNLEHAHSWPHVKSGEPKGASPGTKVSINSTASHRLIRFLDMSGWEFVLFWGRGYYRLNVYLKIHMLKPNFQHHIRRWGPMGDDEVMR